MKKLLCISIILAFISCIINAADSSPLPDSQLKRFEHYYAHPELVKESNAFKNVYDLLNRDKTADVLKSSNVPVPDGDIDDEIKWNYIYALIKSVGSGGVLGSKVRGSDDVRKLLSIKDVDKKALMHMVIEPCPERNFIVDGIPLERQAMTLAGRVASGIVRENDRCKEHHENLKHLALGPMLLGGIAGLTFSFVLSDSPIYIASSTAVGACLGGFVLYGLKREETKKVNFWRENALDIARYFEEQGADFLGSFVGSERDEIQNELEKHTIKSCPYIPS